MAFTTAEIAKHLEGEVLGDATAILNGFAPADAAKPGDLTFAENEDLFRRAPSKAPPPPSSRTSDFRRRKKS